ncbi:MAG TPA: cell division protein FtsZ, partial [Rhodanobacteraceae bacterium]
RTVMSEMGMAMMGTGTARGDDRAVAAAEAAINNPLLEDVNLAGACGILVNVSAGPNLTMREFDDIGQVIHEFASEDATVVVGTALDPELQDEVRVTVVATGLNRAVSRQPLREREREPMAAPRPPMRVIRNATTGAVDYVDVPAPARVAAPEARAAEAPSDYLDIPAFLRRQAD